MSKIADIFITNFIPMRTLVPCLYFMQFSVNYETNVDYLLFKLHRIQKNYGN
jgi:thymidylate synthase